MKSPRLQLNVGPVLYHWPRQDLLGDAGEEHRHRPVVEEGYGDELRGAAAGGVAEHPHEPVDVGLGRRERLGHDVRFTTGLTPDPM